MQVSLADGQIHEFSYHLRDHFIMEAVSIARFSKYVAIRETLSHPDTTGWKAITQLGDS